MYRGVEGTVRDGGVDAGGVEELVLFRGAVDRGDVELVIGPKGEDVSEESVEFVSDVTELEEEAG